MDIPLDTITTGAATSSLLSGIQGISFVYASFAIGLTTLFLSGFEAGRNAIYRVLWWIDGLLGGAPHTVNFPGPTGLPIIGSFHQLKNGHVAKLNEWREKYGDVIRVSLGNREVVYINGHDAIANTIVKQGPAFQSRPTFKLFHSDFGSSGIWTIGASPFSDRLVRTRKGVAGQLTPRLLSNYIPVVYPKLKQLIGDFLDASNGPSLDIAEMLHRFGTGQVCEQFLGTSFDNETVRMLVANETNIARQRTIGKPARDFIPLLAGAQTIQRAVGKVLRIESWARDATVENAREFRRKQGEYSNKFIAELKERLANGDETPSVLGNVLRQNLMKEDELLLATYTGIAAGVNLGYALHWTLIYLANRPDLQKAGYDAIQEVYGGEIPDPYEFDRVEYIKALHTEGSRYFTAVRLAFPRETLQGASYNGQKIPEGTLVIMNVTGANRDPVAFDRPNEFLPERWMDGRKGRTDSFEKGGEKLGMPNLTYGAGRRVCPGYNAANHSMYSALVILLHFFTFERQPLGEEEKKNVWPPLRAERECSLDTDAIKDTATPGEAQAMPWSAGMKFHCRDPEGLRKWLEASQV